MSGVTGNGRHGKSWRLAGWGAAVLLLLTPLVAMQFTNEVDWSVSDFIIFGVMLAVTGGTLELAVRLTSSRAYRAAVGVALATAFILLWVNGAVGIIGSEDNPANLMYFGVLGVGIAGAVIARLKPNGMAGTMVATAAAQTLVAVIALITGLGSTFLVTGFFVALWLISAWLFRQSGRQAALENLGF